MVEEYDSDFGEDVEADDVEEMAEDQMELQQDVIEGMSPSSVHREDRFSLFKWVISKKDSSKVANLDMTELGIFNISVRDMQRIALIGRIFGHKGFAKYFEDLAEIILATSESKEGFLQKLFVSDMKFQQKSRRYNVQNLQPIPKKKGLFK